MSRFVEGVVANAERARTGMVTGEPGAATRRTWSELHAQARRVAGGLIANGLGPGQAVAVLAGMPAEIAPVAQGVWLAGGSVTMLHQPTPRTDLAVWRDDTLRVLRMIDARLVVVGAPFEQMAAALTAYGIRNVSPSVLAGGGDAEPVEADEDSLALLQLTSGSTAEPKAVRITHRNLFANLTDSSTHLSCGEDGVMVSWLPMFHDMGMIGCLALPMLSGLELVSVTPADFLSRPLLWAELMSKYGGTITTAPNFAWAVLTRQLARVEPGTLDLSTLRVACNGAEPIDPVAMRAFVTAASRFGFDPGAVNCCYGAAESTLVISLSEVSDPMMLDRVDPAALERDRLAKPGPREIPMLGRPFPSVEVRVVDDEGAPLGERQVGRLQLRGESVTDGYITPDGFEPARDAEGWLDIGDEGYVADGQIVVCGRRKDVIIMGGRNIYPTDIERAAGAVPGVREGNVAAVRLLAGDGVARESFAVLAESRQAGDADAAEQIAKEVTSRVVAEVDARPAAVRVVPPGSLPKTPSGKLRRAAARALLGNTSD
ncbi:fatty acyl-AMP ligase [Paractinoplanes brasiliensis]|uniref:Fatty-acyl-CoA synthase n=1 Tax=Paractinoplanes brasiliensis TaxID=52695 RepID=A0A4R6J9Y8_9ACTN|nr:fatty acyl-AMP ligase [Actinoplanes brasiliensis]TDO32483.1 fatty-acyl-CoA synthase [Actinoplanes brasiliensis]GID27640.1 fatty-acyl-CoA synthase [Actinoplanes brasiliensis]